MKRYIIVQSGINGSCAKTERYGQHKKKQDGAGKRKAKKSRCSEQRTEKGNHAGTEPAQQAVAVQTRNDGTCGDDHGNESGGGKRCVQIRAHNGPCSAQNGIRQAEADECKINNQKKHGSHRTKYPRFFFSEFSKKDKEFRIIRPALQRYARSSEIPESRGRKKVCRA